MSVRIERLIRIYNRLRRGPVTIEIISKWAKSAGIKVSDRQLYRDLNELKSLRIAEGENVTEFADEKNRKTWKLEYEEKGEKLTSYDINSFFLLKNFAPFSLIEQRKASIEKIEKIIYRSVSKNKYQQTTDANELYLRRTNFIEARYGMPEHEKIEELIWALQNRRMIVIEQDVLNTANLHFKENPFPITMAPLELVFHRARVHIAGAEAATGRFLLFTVDKGFRFGLTNKMFKRQRYEQEYEQTFEKLFGISEPVSDRLHKIKIEFTKGNAEACMNYYWHHSQRWEPLKNGNYLLHLHCSIGREIVGMIVSGIDKVKVHSPKILRDLVLKKLKQNVAVYEQDLEINEEEANADY